MTGRPDDTEINDSPEKTQATIAAVKARLMSDPSFADMMAQLQTRIEKELVASGIPRDRLESPGDLANGQSQGTGERVPPGHECLVYFWDYCWFSVKVH